MDLNAKNIKVFSSMYEPCHLLLNFGNRFDSINKVTDAWEFYVRDSISNCNDALECRFCVIFENDVPNDDCVMLREMNASLMSEIFICL